MIRAFRIGLTLCFVLVSLEVALARQTLVESSGSKFTLSVQGKHITISFFEPRKERVSAGVSAGAPVFDGQIRPGDNVDGVAYAFTRGCRPLPYRVQGTFLKDFIVIQGDVPVRRPYDCRIVRYLSDGLSGRMIFQPAGTEVARAHSRTTESSPHQDLTGRVVLEWTPDVATPEHPDQPETQAVNESLSRYVHLRRLPGDHTELHISWQVGPDDGDPYPAKPNLFGSDHYPSGQLTMEPEQSEADIVIHTVSTGKPDWQRSFAVKVVDGDTREPILDKYHMPIVVSFGVTGDLKCAPGRTDLCDGPTPLD